MSIKNPWFRDSYSDSYPGILILILHIRRMDSYLYTINFLLSLEYIFSP